MTPIKPPIKPGVKLAKLVTPTVETCRHRRDVSRTEGERETAVCDVIVQVSGAEGRELGRVGRDACRACCDAFPPARDSWNPVIASLIHELANRALAGGGLPGLDGLAAGELKAAAEAALNVVYARASQLLPSRAMRPCCYLGATIAGRGDVSAEGPFLCRHPAHETTTAEVCRRCRDWSAEEPWWRPMTLAEMVPLPIERCGLPVRSWSVGVLTAPRRQSTLEWCLDGLQRAGWDLPHVFVDGTIRFPEAYAQLPVTWRERRVGAWPNFYLALAEMAMRDPVADAYFLLQDDAVLYDGGDLREYLESVLWPGEDPGLISLFGSQAYETCRPGWHSLLEPWTWCALAFLFPRGLAREFLSDPFVVGHRWEGSRGTAQVDVLIGDWARGRGVSVRFPSPSLVQHVGNTSTIWRDARIAGPRRASWFAGDLESPFAHKARLDDFDEDLFTCPAGDAEDYLQRVHAGSNRMRRSRAVICGLCRNVRHFLPRLAARVEQLGQAFGDYRVVLFENDSQDATPEFLRVWQRKNERVHVLSEALGHPRLAQDRNRHRAQVMSQYRNRYRQYVLDRYGDFDYVIVADTDLAGGWSYDGIAHTFGHECWDFVGSNGLLRRLRGELAEDLQFDAWAFRMANHPQPHSSREINALRFFRGQPMLPVYSCFGGLGVYRMEAMRGAEYDGPDCEHVVLHARMRAQGFDRLFLNPSQIVLYSPV